MQKIYSIYLSALRAFVQGTMPEKPDAAQLQGLLELAKIHSTQGIVSYVYMSHPELVPPEMQKLLRKQCLAQIALYTKRAEQVKLLAAELDKTGIDGIFFKGFVVREYYPVAELRTFGDVDILIRKEDREKSDRLMHNLGYEPHENWEPSYSYLKGSEYYELHSRVIGFNVSDKADYVDYFSHIWEHTQPSEIIKLPHAMELTPEYHFLYLLAHIAKHISGSGAGARMYLDIAFFIRHAGSGMDWNRIAEELQKLNLADFANVALTAVERWFGVKSPLTLRAVPEDVIDDFLEFTLSGGVYGYAGRDKSIVFLKQQNRNDAKISKFKTLMFHAFPPARSLKNRYPYLQKHPWLLPAAWINRLADSRKEWGRFAANTKGILTANEEDAKKLKKIYKEIGL